MLTCSSSLRCLRLAVVMMLVSLVHSRNLLERAGLWMEMLPALNTDSTEPSATSGGGGLEEKPGKPALHGEFCGTRPGLQRFQQRIVGGESAKEGQFPWQAMLALLPPKGRSDLGPARFCCGAVLINTRTVLTAAHCIKERSERYEVWLGRLTSDLGKQECGQQRLRVTKAVKHPQFNPSTLKYDIAVLGMLTEFGQGAQFSEWVVPACLPAPRQAAWLYYTAQSPRPGCPRQEVQDRSCSRQGLVSGWGLQDEAGTSVSPDLQHVTVPMVEDSQCDKMYSALTKLKEFQFCAGTTAGGKDACAGDSGGPLVVEQEGRFYLAGLVSFGRGCGRAAYPGVYTRLTSFLPWIQEVMRDIQPNSKSLTSSTTRSTTTRSRSTTTRNYPTTISSTTTTTTTTSTTTTTTTPTTTTTTRRTRPPYSRPTRRTTTRMTTKRPSRKNKKAGPVCKGESERIMCPRGTVIKIMDGFYGRKRRTRDCPSRYTRMRNGCEHPKATKEAQEACNGKRICILTTGVKGYQRNGIFSPNRCAMDQPYLTVTFQCAALISDGSEP